MKSYVLSSDYVRTSTDNVESKYGDVHLSLRGAPTVLFSCKSVLTKERTKALFSFSLYVKDVDTITTSIVRTSAAIERTGTPYMSI